MYHQALIRWAVRNPKSVPFRSLFGSADVRKHHSVSACRFHPQPAACPTARDNVLSNNQWHHVRWSSSKKRQRQMKSAGADPFTVLGVTRAQTFVAVKRAFLQIAMKHHPDTAAAGTEKELEANKEIFMAARKAFEAMVAGPDGLAILKSEAADYVEEDLDEWFKTETGYDMPFMDAATMKEVAEMTESVGGGLDRDGGMWTLARMVADTVKSGGDGRSLLQLEAGVVRDKGIDGVLRRKRRR